MAQVCKKVEIGSVNGIPEFKVVWEKKGFIRIPVAYVRKSKMIVSAEFCAPSDVMRNSWKDIEKCAIAAGVTAGIAAIVSSPAAALPAFKVAFMSCVSAKIADARNKIRVALSTRQKAGEWKRK